MCIVRADFITNVSGPGRLYKKSGSFINSYNLTFIRWTMITALRRGGALHAALVAAHFFTGILPHLFFP